MKLARSTLAFAAAAFIASSANAQIAPPRTLDELKTETQARADRNVYPLGGLKPDDVREALGKINSLDRDEWAAAWSSVAERYATRAKAEEAANDAKAAQADYLMAWRVYSFARWPTTNSPGKLQAYKLALEAFRNAARFLDPPLETVRIPFEGHELVGYLRLPKGVAKPPIVMAINALDSRKEDALDRSGAFLKRGIATFSLDMPGTGEMPIKVDIGAERVFSRALDYLATRSDVDAGRVAVLGVSWSGYWAAKLGIIERQRLKGVVVQGGPIHYYFQREWQSVALGTREYLFDLFAARASLYGATTLDEFYAYGPKLSLKDEGYLDKPSAPMLVVNGDKDTQVPIADLDLLLHAGSAKEAWVNPSGGHTGRNAEWPDARIFAEVVAPWLERRLNGGE